MNETVESAISVSEMVSRVWRGRGYIVAVTLLMLLLGLAIAAFSGFSARKSVSHYIALSNIEDSKYPNGTSFQPGDIVSLPVLENLRKRLGVDAEVDLASNIRATFDNPLSQGVEQLYRERLSARNLTQTEVEAINTSFATQLDAVSKSSVRIDVDFTAMGVSKETAVAMAIQLPSAWSEVYTKQFRTLVSQELSASVPVSTITDFNSVTGVISIATHISNMHRGIKVVAADNRLNSVQDSNGFTAEDLQSQLSLYSDVYFNPLFSSNLGSESSVAKLYLKDRELRIQQLIQENAGLDQAFDKLRADQVRSEIAAPSGTEGPTGQPSLQIDSGALTQIMGLAEKASNGEYIRQLLSRRQANIEQIAEINRRIEIIQPTRDLRENNTEFVQAAFQGFNAISASYNQILAAARSRAEERSGVLYQPLSSPKVNGSLLDVRYILLAIGLALLGFILSTAYAIFLTTQRVKSAV